MPDSSYWNRIGKEFQDCRREYLWRIHMKQIYSNLLNRWTENSDNSLAIKTDLFDEAISPYYIMSLAEEKFGKALGMDISFDIARTAKRRMKEDSGVTQNHVIICDVRNMGFKDGCFDPVISPSTLDHFEQKNDIVLSLKEIFRVMKPDGNLVITLDNPFNPVVLIRNLLPHRLMMMLGIIPFRMGLTVSIFELIRMLEFVGFKVLDHTAIAHTPRILAIRMGQILDKIGNKILKDYFFRIMGIFERLEYLPTRFFTGYFIAVKARKEIT